MKWIRQGWRYLTIEVFTWTFRCFFQPMRFNREYEKNLDEKKVFKTYFTLMLYPCLLIWYFFLFLIFIPTMFSLVVAMIIGENLNFSGFTLLGLLQAVENL